MCHLWLIKPWWTTSNKLQLLAAAALYCKRLKRIYQMPSIRDVCTLDTSDDKLLGNFGFRWGRERQGKNDPQRKKSCLDLYKNKTIIWASLKLRIANYNDCSNRISWIIIYYLFWMSDWLKTENDTTWRCVYYLPVWMTMLDISLQRLLKNLQSTESFRQRGTFKSQNISLQICECKWHCFFFEKYILQSFDFQVKSSSF